MPTPLTLARRGILCLAIGAPVTFLSSAALAVFSPVGDSQYQRWREMEYPFAVPEHWPDRPHRSVRYSAPGFEVEAWHARGPVIGDASAGVYRSGWPCFAMVRHQLREDRHRSDQSQWVVWGAGAIRGGVAVPERLRPILPAATRHFRHRIPLAPIPAGFAINTLLFAVIAYALIYAAGHVARARRRARGLCEVCGYDARPLAVCPECGEALSEPGKLPDEVSVLGDSPHSPWPPRRGSP